MQLYQKKLRDEQAAMQKLIRQIDGIEADKNKVGRTVLTVSAIVFLAAATLLVVVLLNAQGR